MLYTGALQTMDGTKTMTSRLDRIDSKTLTAHRTVKRFVDVNGWICVSEEAPSVEGWFADAEQNLLILMHGFVRILYRTHISCYW